MERQDRGLSEPVTEQPNELSKNIDMSSPKEIASILYKCDQEIFDGWKGCTSLTCAETISKILKVALEIEKVLEDPSIGTVVISGCGTSGRLAYVTARQFNKYLRSQGKEEIFQYIIAGNDPALFTSQELAEDDPLTGAKSLKKAVEGKSRVVYIGISCGLSAVFVAGQLDLCLSDLKRFTPIVLGFNPPHLARELPIKNWKKTFLSVMNELLQAEKQGLAHILTPVIGPEPITGSTRMKSGSATRIILECLAMAAIHAYTDSRISQLLTCYRETCDSVYRQEENLGQLIDTGGKSLCNGGHIYYLGSDGFGLMAMIDASECPPTYSASLDDVRGFVNGGYDTLANNDGDLSKLGFHYKISFDDFLTLTLPSIKDCDSLIIIGHVVLQELGSHIASASCMKVYIGIDNANLSPDLKEQFQLIINLNLSIPSLDSMTGTQDREITKQLLQEVALKWVLNNLSTGSHILKGKVFENRMIDVKVSNTKLYYRAIGIVQNFAKCTYKEAEESLLKSIYGVDEISQELNDNPLVEHIKTGANSDQVVPTAILHVSLKCSVQEARNMIKTEPVIRKLLQKPAS